MLCPQYPYHTLSQQIERMESEFQLQLAVLVFQSHSEIMMKMIQLRFSQTTKYSALVFQLSNWKTNAGNLTWNSDFICSIRPESVG